MNRYLFYVLMLLCATTSAQQQKLDSLERLLSGTLADTTRISVLLEKAKMQGVFDKPSADSLLQSAKAMARKMDPDENRAIAFEAIGNHFMHSKRFDSAVVYFHEAVNLHKKTNNIPKLAHLQSSLGNAYYFKADYNQTLYHFLERLSYCEQLADSTCISAACNNAGLVLIKLGRYEDAIDYTLRSLKIDETLGYQPGILSSQMSMGNINYHLKNYDKAIKYYLDIVATCEAMGNQELRISYAYNNIASIYFQQKEFEKAEEFYSKSLALEEEFGDDNGIALKYNNLGSIHKELDQLDIAQDYFDRALQLRKDLGDLYGMASTENNLGQLYLAKGNPAKALQFYRVALGHAEKAGSLEATKIAHEGMAKAYKNQGRYRSALENYERFLTLNDSLLNTEKAKKITELEARYQSKKKENEIALLKKNEELQQVQMVQQEASLRASEIQRNLLFAGIAVLLTVGFLMVYSYRQRLAAKELIQKNQKETEEIRSRFFAGISHEFRTPLTLISAPVEQLQKKYRDEKETHSTLGLIRQNANKLLKLINQILDLSKLEEGKLQLQLEKGDIISWLRVISSSFTSLADGKDIVFTRQFPKERTDSFFDREKIEQMVTNLLSNAMKFTPNGGAVEFIVNTGGNQLHIVVKNTDSPISEADQSRIFDRFYQADTLQYSQGTGIGLALVKELAELHKGQVSVHSDNDHTTFSLSIPLDDSVYADDKKMLPRKTKPETTDSAESYFNQLGKRAELENRPIVLLAEDNDDLRSYVGLQLCDDYEVKEAQNGSLAWEAAVKGIPDIIVTDLMMPDMDGEALLEKLRNDPKTQHIPVIMLTARTEQESRLTSIGKGADHYLTKPFDVQELKVRIKSLLEQRKRIRDFHKSQFLTNPKPENIVSSDDRFLQQIGHIMAKNLDNTDFSVDEFAAEMGMSRVQLYRKMKAIIGYSASDFIRQYRLKKAYEYLQNHKGTVSEIAYDVGFNNLSYFTKTFKEVYHLKPSEILHPQESPNGN